VIRECERHVRAAPGQAARREVETERPELHQLLLGGGGAGRRGRRPPPQHRLDARHQLPRIERFGQVVVRADFQPHDALHVVALGGEHDDRQGFPAAAQAPAYRQAVLAGQHEIEDHQVVALARKLPVHLGGVVYHAHREALLGEIAVEQVAQPGVVVHDEDFRFQFGHGNGRFTRFRALNPNCSGTCAPEFCKSLLQPAALKQIVSK